MALADRLQRDASKVFLRLGHFAEEVVYTPFGGSPRTIAAQVFRHAQGMQSNGQTILATIFIANDPVAGVVSVSKKDTVTLAVSFGATPQTLKVNPAMQQDPGMWELNLG